MLEFIPERALKNDFEDTTQEKEWEKAFDYAFLRAMGRDGQDGYSEEREELKNFIHTTRQQAVEETEKAFGGCTNCYGKGYHTTKIAMAGRHFRKDLNPYVPCDKCDRGKQFSKAMEYAVEEDRERMRKAVEGMQWPEPPLFPNDPIGDDTWKQWYYHEITVNKLLTLLTSTDKSV